MGDEQQIIENNILIANYLDGEVKVVYSINGKDYYAWYGKMAKFYRQSILKIKFGECIDATSLHFNDNWLWLMPIVDKIENNGACVNIYETRCKINNLPDGYMFLADTGNKLESTYKCLVDAIKFLNKRSKK